MLRRILASSCIITLCASLLPIHSTAHAAGAPVVDVKMSIVADGTASFDADDAPGNDSSDDNGIVRTLDTVAYKVEVNLNQNDAANTAVTLTASTDLRWTQLPANCLSEDVTPASSISTDGLTMVCNVGVVKEGSAALVFPVAQVRASAANGAIVEASVSGTADGANTAIAGPLATEVTAAPKVDLRKVIIDSRNSIDANGPSGENGQIMTYGLTLVAEKGSEMLDGSDIIITDTLDYIYNDNSPTTQNGARLYNWGPEGAAGACSPSTVVNPSAGVSDADIPYGRIGLTADATAENAVADSGTITCTQGDDSDPSTFDAITITISDADFGAASTPTETANGTAISGDEQYLVSAVLNVWIPESDIAIPANLAGSGYDMVTRNTFSTIDPDSITAQSNYGAGTEDASNNAVDVAVSTNTPAGSGARGNGITFSAPRNGTKTILPGETTIASIFHRSQAIGDQNILCAKADLSKFTFVGDDSDYSDAYWRNLRDRTYTNTTQELNFLGADGVWNTGDEGASHQALLFDVVNPAVELRMPPSPRFEYTSVPVVVEYSNEPLPVGTEDVATCSDADGGSAGWNTDLNAIGGPSAATRARITFTTIDNRDNEAFNNHYVRWGARIRVNDGLPEGERVGLFISSSWDNGVTWTHTDAATNDDNDPGYAFDGTRNYFSADRLIVTTAKVRVSKEADVHQIEAGDTVTFTLSPTLSSGAPTTTSVTVVDTLPTGLEYVDNSSLVTNVGPGQTVSGPVISGNTLTWTIDNITTGDDLPAITFQAISDIKLTSATLVNSVEVTSPIDTGSSVAERTDTKTVYLQERGTFNVMKLLADPDDPVVEIGEPIQFELTYANLSETIDMSEEQFIEVFPFNGDSTRVPPTSYNGTLDFVSITGSYGETFEYTSRAIDEINMDPCHASNVATGITSTSVCQTVVDDAGDATAGVATTTWYDCSGGFNSGAACPITEVDVTGIRISAPGLPAGTSRQTLLLTLQPTNNQEGDVYTNDFGGRTAEIDLPTFSNDVTITVVASSIGNTVWFDLDGDGMQDAGEAGISNVTINLYDDQGVLIATTTTDASGQYAFTNLPSGDYTVTVDDTTLPSGVTQTSDLDSVATGHTADVSLGINEDQTDVNFGYQGAASIGDFVWNDADFDGIQDASETGVAGVDIKATWAGADGVFGTDDDLTFSTTTDAQGNYLFDNLPAGNYDVAFTLPDGTAYVPQAQGGDTAADSDVDPTTGSTGSFALAAGEDRTDIDFGVAAIFDPPSSLKTVTDHGAEIEWKMVWLNGGIGLALNSQVIDAIPTGTTYTNDSLVCDARGTSTTTRCEYDSANDRVIWEGAIGSDVGGTTEENSDNEVVITFRTDVPDELNTAQNQACANWDANNDGSINDDIVGGQVAVCSTDPNSSSGGATIWERSAEDYTGNSSIGNTIWLDADGDGVQDDDEKGLEDIRVKLTWAGPDGEFGNSDDVVWRTDTNHNGHYLFEDLPEGRYRVRVKAEDVAQYTQTYDPDDKKDLKDTVTLESNDDYTKADFGFNCPHCTTGILPRTGEETRFVVAGSIALLSFGGFAAAAQRRRRLVR